MRVTRLIPLVLAAYLLAACGSSTTQSTNASNSNSAAPPPASGKLTVPAKFLLIGDSLMIEGFGPALEKAINARAGFTAVRNGVYSTGLNRFDYFDWSAKAEELIKDNKPDALIVMFGANDGQGITDLEGKDHPLGTPEWSTTYAKRVNAFLTRISPLVKKIYWVGHPIPGNENFYKKISAMNPVYESEAAKFPNVVYVNEWDRFAVNGKFSPKVTDDDGRSGAVKNSDGIHVTDFGGKIMASVVLKAIEKDVEPKAP
ncbi:MAG: DUF459 domain-containing protein [Acidobacteria bacterium]|nr:DUF459 domain-containing protein [Acidobacteriota bacterium]